jgi:methionine synthase I (cobalamin-dependent)
MVAHAAIPLEQALEQRVLMLNASTMNPAWHELPEAAWGGRQFMQTPSLNLTRPDLVLEWSIELLAAGTDILEAHSLGADAFTGAEVGADRAQCRAWTRAAVAIAHEANARQKYIIGAVGPSTDLLTVRARHTFEEHVAAFTEQILDLWAAGVDAIHLAYYADSKNLRAALCGVSALEEQLACRIPTMITFDLNYDGTILSGERPEELWEMFRDYKPIALGLATYGYGSETVRRLRDVTDLPIGFLLDSCPYGTPENRPIEWLAECLGPLLDDRLLNFCGLSCTVPSIEYVKAIGGLIQRTSAA